MCNHHRSANDWHLWLHRIVEYDLIVSDAYCDAYGNHTRSNNTDSDSERIIITIRIDSSPTENV